MGILNLGTPIAVDVARIEQELSSLWKSASESEGEQSVIRACSCNLVIIVRDQEEAAALSEITARVAELHPSRSLVAYAHPPREAAGMRAWINTQCTIPFAGAPQVCCETVTLTAQEDSALHLVHTLVSLLVPDLPVFLYLRSSSGAAMELASLAAQYADLLIVDSRISKDDAALRAQLNQLLAAPPQDVQVRDLNWSRLTAWRELIAQFFDAPACRDHIWEIEEVVITRKVPFEDSLPTRTFLLSGWLASRLGWKPIEAYRDDKDWISRWQGQKGEIRICFKAALLDKPAPPTIESIDIHTRSGLTFRIDCDAQSMHARTDSPELSLQHSVPTENQDEGSLLIHELSISGEDSGFRRALAEAIKLETMFQNPRSR